MRTMLCRLGPFLRRSDRVVTTVGPTAGPGAAGAGPGAAHPTVTQPAQPLGDSEQ